MNNTSRLKIYGILAAVVIVVAGVVWFYPRTHSSKVPHVTNKPVKTGTVKFAAAQSAPAAHDYASKPQPTFGFANATDSSLPTFLAHNLRLNDEEALRIVEILDSCGHRVYDILGENATITKASDSYVWLETSMPDDEATKMEKDTYSKIYDILGEDRRNLMDNPEVNHWINQKVNSFGRDLWGLTVMGAVYLRGQSSPDYDQEALPISEDSGLIVWRLYGEPGSLVKRGGVYFYSPKQFTQAMGKLAEKALEAAQNVKNTTQ